MARVLLPQRRVAASPAPDPTAIIGALPGAVLVLGPDDVVRYVNPSAEQLLGASAAVLCGTDLRAVLPADSQLFALARQVRLQGASISEAEVTLDSPRTGLRHIAVQAAPLSDPDGFVVMAIHERSMARKIDQQMNHRSAARSVTAMAAMLAHEVKNPLSGIRGAAQLLEQTVVGQDRELTRLICDEADRIRALVDRMEIFSERPLHRGPVNIHEVLEHVRRLAQSGFARRARFVEVYDPSLPPVLGHRDQLIQVFLNLVKNAAEAAPPDGAEITLATAYQPGLRLAVPGGESRVQLPLVVSVQDNGAGIPDDVRPHLFDPFVTTKTNGSGLGLALVAKIVGDLGGIVEFDSQPRRTVFRVLLPIADMRAAG